THRDTNTQTDRQRRHTPTGLPHLCSCAATCTESMMRRRASEICFARTVCCSNLVFTADWETHSNTHTDTHKQDIMVSEECSNIPPPLISLKYICTQFCMTTQMPQRLKGTCA